MQEVPSLHLLKRGVAATMTQGAYHEGEGVTLLLGDCRDVMAQLEPESVSCVSCSPPFFGLRKYTCEPSIWGGDPNCPHSLKAQPVDGESYAGRRRWQHDGVSRQETPEAWEKETKARRGHPGDKTTLVGTQTAPISKAVGGVEHATCSLCGAWRGQLGLEPTAEMYVEHTIEWLTAVKRVLRKDGVVWLDIDDSRSGSGKGQMGDGSQGRAGAKQRTNAKNLCLIPQRIAIAAQEDGWIVRSEIIIPTWMPESAKDRPTDACRKVLMLVKSKSYWYDGQAVRMPQVEGSAQRVKDGHGSGGKWDDARDWSRTAAALRDDRWDEFVHADGLRNLGSVWDDIPPAAYPDSHFAVFPVDEPLRCILASCPAEICVKCGKARWRVVKKARILPDDGSRVPLPEGQRRLAVHRDAARAHGGEHDNPFTAIETKGWTDCGCGAGFEPGLVLDPFIGTGTTAIAARKLGRRCIGIDASEDYLQQAVTRLTVGDAGIRRMVEARKQGSEQMTLFCDSGPTGPEGGMK